MKTIVEFDLKDEDDALSYERFKNSRNMVLSLDRISRSLREKFEDMSSFNEIEVNLIQVIFDKISEILEDHGIDLDELL